MENVPIKNGDSESVTASNICCKEKFSWLKSVLLIVIGGEWRLLLIIIKAFMTENVLSAIMSYELCSM